MIKAPIKNSKLIPGFFRTFISLKTINLKIMCNSNTFAIYVIVLLSFCSELFGQVLNEERNFDGFKNFAQRVELKKTSWDDLVLADTEIAKLKEIVSSFKQISKTKKSNKLIAESSIKSGINLLFIGEGGANKTLTATLLAYKLDLNLYRIDLSMVVSKYIGETEKNLSEIFDKAENKNWILFFDEADSLFGMRGGDKNNKNKYVNREVYYFMHRVELYQGLVIISTSSKTRLNDSKLNPFKYTIPFPKKSKR